jgi:hypothetical protein
VPVRDKAIISEFQKLQACLSADAKQFVTPYGTQRNESINNTTKKNASKRINYSNSWAPRTLFELARVHLGDIAIANLVELLDCHVSDELLAELQNLTLQADRESSHKRSEAYTKEQHKRDKESKGKRRLEILWQKAHGDDDYDGERLIDYDHLSELSAKELGHGYRPVAPTKQPRRAGDASAAARPRSRQEEPTWTCDFCVKDYKQSYRYKMFCFAIL